MRTRTPFIDSLVLSFFENIRMVMSAKIELCVIRQILLNLIFCNDRQILLFEEVRRDASLTWRESESSTRTTTSTSTLGIRLIRAFEPAKGAAGGEPNQVENAMDHGVGYSLNGGRSAVKGGGGR